MALSLFLCGDLGMGRVFQILVAVLMGIVERTLLVGLDFLASEGMAATWILILVGWVVLAT